MDPSDYEWFEIVGVVGPFGTNPINPTRDAGVYHPLAAGEANPVRYLIETSADPKATFSHEIRRVFARNEQCPTWTVEDRMCKLPRHRRAIACRRWGGE